MPEREILHISCIFVVNEQLKIGFTTQAIIIIVSIDENNVRLDANETKKPKNKRHSDGIESNRKITQMRLVHWSHFVAIYIG